VPAKNRSVTDLVRAVEYLEPYPAVLMPMAGGGFDVIFPNFPNLRVYGATAAQAMNTAQEMLTNEVSLLIHQGDPVPRPSDPERLVPDEDEPPGTRMIMVTPDRKRLRQRFKLDKRERGGILSSLGK
jgi:predicted RNase H-like HicB family nuclease